MTAATFHPSLLQAENVVSPAATTLAQPMSTPHLEFKDLSVYYGAKRALNRISLRVPKNTVLGIVGPANSGKSTLLKTINRTIYFISTAKVDGYVALAGA